MRVALSLGKREKKSYTWLCYYMLAWIYGLMLTFRVVPYVIQTTKIYDFMTHCVAMNFESY